MHRHWNTAWRQVEDDAYFKALNADEQDYDFITVVGGDGTINEVVSGMVASDKKFHYVYWQRELSMTSQII